MIRTDVPGDPGFGVISQGSYREQCMPVTPFHCGPATLAKAALGRRFSMGVFAFVQVVIDLEVLWHMFRGAARVHTHMHTAVGALAVGIALVVPGRLFVSWFNGVLRRDCDRHDAFPPWLRRELVPVSWTAAVISSVAGALSHVAFDALMHADVRPWAPWSSENQFLIPGSFGAIHLVFSALGVVGLLAWLAMLRSKPEQISKSFPTE